MCLKSDARRLLVGLMCLLLGCITVATSFAAGESAGLSLNPSIAKEQPKPVVIVDEIDVKQKEMRDATLMVTTRQGTGSGTIIKKTKTDEDGHYEYFVLTNSHVTHMRWVNKLAGVDCVTGKLEIQSIDTGCGVILFNHETRGRQSLKASVVAEDFVYDLAMLSFRTSETLPVSKVASKDILMRVRVFDDVFAIGCQLGGSPTPTKGIISKVAIGSRGEKEWIVYGTTAQITPGSSGGGLFKEHDGHYYLIGIPYKIAVANNGQMVPHLAHAISIFTARNFIDENTVTTP